MKTINGVKLTQTRYTPKHYAVVTHSVSSGPLSLMKEMNLTLEAAYGIAREEARVNPNAALEIISTKGAEPVTIDILQKRNGVVYSEAEIVSAANRLANAKVL